MRERSWWVLEPDPPELRLPDDLRARDPLGGRDCGWVSQMRPFIRAYSRPGETVFDPFCGFGTTLLAAALEGRRGIGVEIDRDRIVLARERLRRHDIDAQITRGTLPLKRWSEPFDLCLTNVPYFGCDWPAQTRGGQLYNVPSYDLYLTTMRSVFHAVHKRLPDNGFFIAMVQNARIRDRMVPQAWDLARILGSLFEPCEERILLYPEQETTNPSIPDDPTRTDRTHEYALVFRKRRPCMDVVEGRAMLEFLRKEGFEFNVVGSFRLSLDDAHTASAQSPSDIDLVVPDDAERLRALLQRLEGLSFRLSLWGDAVNADIRPETVRAHHYLRAERLKPDGALLRIDIALEEP